LKLRDLERHLVAHGARKVGELEPDHSRIELFDSVW
jgi:hypothetical protein